MKIILKITAGLLIVLLTVASCFSCKNRTRSGTADAAGFYHEKYRPQYHFSPESGWMNDPNGLVYNDGEYHLFYQYYPDSTVWGPMHWGHAVGTDLVHWKHLPVALYPDSLGYIFSGSAVTDRDNTSGLREGTVPPLIAIFTYHNSKLERSGNTGFQSQGLAWSNDRGRTWNKYQGNPVLPNPGIKDFRDPKVIWHEASGRWIMILAVHDRVNIYSSPDLKNWSFESEFGENAGSHGGVWECPDLFPLAVTGTSLSKWVMLVSINPGGPNGGSATQYFTGDFDGHKFTPDNTSVKWMDLGTDNYAGVTWSGIPASDGRRILLGWMSNWNYATVVPASTWRSAMTIPRKLSLYTSNGDYFLASSPVNELKNLRADSLPLVRQGNSKTPNGITIKGDPGLSRSELDLDFIATGADTVGIALENELSERLLICYSALSEEVFIDRSGAGDASFSPRFTGIVKAPYKAGERISMHLFVDATSVELFIDDGRLVMTSVFFPSENFSSLKIYPGRNGNLLQKGIVYHLNGIWQ